MLFTLKGSKHTETVIFQNKAKGMNDIVVDLLDIMLFHRNCIYDAKIKELIFNEDINNRS